MSETNIATMSAAQLEALVQILEMSHRRRMKSLRALARAKYEEEQAQEGEQ